MSPTRHETQHLVPTSCELQAHEGFEAGLRSVAIDRSHDGGTDIPNMFANMFTLEVPIQIP
jgi:hypothetical protein